MMGVGSGTLADDTACSSDINNTTLYLVLCTQFQHIFCDKFVSNYTNFGHSPLLDGLV